LAFQQSWIVKLSEKNLKLTKEDIHHLYTDPNPLKYPYKEDEEALNLDKDL
jgi:hypothetical protein